MLSRFLEGLRIMFKNGFILHGVLILNLCVIQTDCHCKKCIQCLPQGNGKQYWKNAHLVFDKGKCPKKYGLEYFYLEQILYMFKGHTNWPEETKKKVPCYKDCTGCYNRIIGTCLKIKPHFWDKNYKGLFFKDETVFRKVLSERTMTRYLNNTQRLGSQTKYSHSTQRLSRQADSCKTCCHVRASKPKFFIKKVKIQGEVWYPIYFNHPSHGTKQQIYEKIICTSGCSLVETIHSFVVTPLVPSPDFGHSFYLLNHNADHLRFYEAAVGGYCKCQII